jgi:enoyl-CoA hydratase
MSATYENILVTREEAIAIVQLNRPKVHNALSHALIGELTDALGVLDKDNAIRVIVLTGNERAFAAGADISEMSQESSVSILLKDQFAVWDKIRQIKKPIIAAVSGFTLGGGLELVMNCDIIIASENAKFGQPEINLGIIPGAGGTQRLTRLVGKYKAMEMILTGEMINAQEALRIGLVNKIVPVELYLEEAKKMAKQIAKKSPIALQLAKDAILKSYETSLSEGLQHERKNFYMLFATADQKEGMSAFLEKREAVFKGC